MDASYIELGEKLLERLQGRLHFSLTKEERFEFALKRLDEILQAEPHQELKNRYASPESKTVFLNQFFSYDVIDEFLNGDEVEDIAINALHCIYVHTSDQGLIKTDKKFQSFKELNFFILKLLVFAGKSILKKTNDFELPYIEGRVNVVESPFGPQVTVTKIKKVPLSLIELIERESLGYRIGGFLWLLTEGCGLRPANILIVGGPGAGKTTLLNALLSLIPDNERVVVIEDTLELNTNLRDSFCRLETTEEMTLEDLVKNSLRMRPDRIVVGEVRGREAQDMITAMNLGKYCMCTIHASNTQEAFSRLENFPMNVPPGLLNLIDIVIVVNRFYHRKTVRRVIKEISETAFMEQKRPLVSKLWKYDFEKDVIQEVSQCTIFREKLALASGRTLVDIMDEAEKRSRLMYCMHQQQKKSFQELSAMASLYSRNPHDLMDYLHTSDAKLAQLEF